MFVEERVESSVEESSSLKLSKSEIPKAIVDIAPADVVVDYAQI